MWVCGFLIILPTFYGWGRLEYDAKLLHCSFSRKADYSYNIFLMITGILVPNFVTIFSYINIFRYVRQSKRKVMSNDSSNAKAAAKQRKESLKLAMTLCTIYVMFVICWGPLMFFVIADIKDTFPMELYAVACIMGFFNSCINIVIYGITNTSFRHGYIKLLHLDRWKWCRQKTDDSTSSSSTIT